MLLSEGVWQQDQYVRQTNCLTPWWGPGSGKQLEFQQKVSQLLRQGASISFSLLLLYTGFFPPTSLPLGASSFTLWGKNSRHSEQTMSYSQPGFCKWSFGHTAISIHGHMVHNCSRPTEAKLSDCNRHPVTCKASVTYCLALYRKSLLTPVLEKTGSWI